MQIVGLLFFKNISLKSPKIRTKFKTKPKPIKGPNTDQTSVAKKNKNHEKFNNQ